jgi:hypothetical protein
MPPSRHQPPPQTSKKARRAYLKSNKHFEFTSTQQRASERRLELDKRARTLQAKEQRKKDTKRKREEKEASEREERRKRVQSGKAPLETLWGKVRASQPRLNAFFSNPNAINKEPNNQSESESEGDVNYDHNSEAEIAPEPPQHTAQGAADTQGLENFFSSSPFTGSATMVGAVNAKTPEELGQSKAKGAVMDGGNINNLASSRLDDPDQAMLDAQPALSQGIWDFDIAEDDDADWALQGAANSDGSHGAPDIIAHRHLLATPSKRKASDGDFEFMSPAKSARTALTEMSPSKVNIRSQEKPDIFSVAPFAAKLPSPTPAKQTGNETAADVLAMIATQDLEDEEFSTDKENEDPWQAESRKRSQKDDNSQKKTVPSNSDMKQDASRDYGAADRIQSLCSSYDEDIFDDDEFGALESDFEDGHEDYDDYDRDLDDEALAALTAQSPSAHKLALLSKKITASITGGSPRTAKHPQSATLRLDNAPGNRSMPPPFPPASKPSQVGVPHPQGQLPPATLTNSLSFESLPDDDLTAFAEGLDADDSILVQQGITKVMSSRRIPWNYPPLFPTSQGSYEPLSQDEDPPYD